jgi:hypothetical protein
MTVLKQRPINESGVNFDSDQDILGHTIIADGKWRFFEGEVLIAETDAPREQSREILEQWCAAVRARTKRELDQTDIDKRIEARRENPGGIVGTDGKPLDSHDPDTTPAVEPVVEEEENPDAWIDAKIEKAEARLEAVRDKEREIRALIDELGGELTKADKDLTKWTKLKEAMEDDG